MVAQKAQGLQKLTRLLLVSLAVGAASGGCSNGQDDFTSGRSDDPCNGAVPACNSVVGCSLTDSSYTTGTFPGSGKFLVQTPGPASVEVHFYLSSPSAAGSSDTFITWFESGCTTSFQADVPGKVFVGEAEAANGEFVRTQLLSAPGDHLVTFESAATTGYFVKVVIVPVVPTSP